MAAAERAIASKASEFREQYGLKESSFGLDFRKTSDTPSEVFTQQSADQLVSLLLLLPHGVSKMSHAVEGDLSINAMPEEL